jgi:hypothetical protein
MTTTAFSAKSIALAAIAAVATVGAAMLGSSSPAQAEVVQLERVLIVGKRSATAAEAAVVAQLPRVVITGRSTASRDEVQVAAAGFKARAL